MTLSLFAQPFAICINHYAKTETMLDLKGNTLITVKPKVGGWGICFDESCVYTT